MKNIEYSITSMEAAEMVEKQHKDLMRDIKRYIEQMHKANEEYRAERKVAPGDFFKESSYRDANNQERPCYRITKKGCEFIAHKLTGVKGTEFTARYINRFHAMETELKNLSMTEIPVGEVASYLKAMDRVAVRQSLAPYKIAENFKKVSEQFGIQLTTDFVKVPEYEQMALDIMVK